MVVNIHKNTVFLDNKPFTATSYLRSVTDDLVTRFGSAEQGQTNLDLLKAETQKGFRGGMFQPEFDDPEKAAFIENGYFNKVDGKLYPTPLFTKNAKESALMDSDGIYDWCFLNDFVYASFRFKNTGQNGMFYMSANSGTITQLTLPSALQTSSRLKLTPYKENIYIAAYGDNSGVPAYKYVPGGAFSLVGDTTGNFSGFMEFNGTLYGIMYLYSTFHQITNAASTPITWAASIGNVGPSTIITVNSRHYHDYAVFNNTLYIAMETGLFRFDGTKVYAVLDYTKAADIRNFEKLAVFNGRLYYNIKNKLFQFDGINIEEIQDFTDGYRITAITAGPDRLWISTICNSNISSVDRGSITSNGYYPALFCYNGVGFFLYRLFINDPNHASFPLTNLVVFPVYNKIFAVLPSMNSPTTSDGFYRHTCLLSDEFVTYTKINPVYIISSIIDNDYPSVTKALNGILLTFDPINVMGARYLVECSYFVDGAWSSWTQVWLKDTYASTTGLAPLVNDYALHDQYDDNLSVPAVYRKVRFRISMTWSDSSTFAAMPTLRDVSLRYTIQPKFRLKWLLTLDIQGVDTRGITTPTNSDGVREDRTAAQLRKVIYDAYRNKLPILFYDADFTAIQGISGSVRVHGTDFIVGGDNVAIQNNAALIGKWINYKVKSTTYDEVNDRTSLELFSGGYRSGIGGIANPVSITLVVGSQVRKSHAVYIRSIRNESYIIDPNTLNDNAGQGKYSDIPSRITLDLVEV